MLLAIDTSTDYTGVACYDQRGLLGECAWQSGRNHATQIMPQVDLLVRHLGLTHTDLTAVGVARGPGSWSGLRVGMSTAKGLALARDIPIIGVGTLDALVYQHRSPRLPVYPLIRLGRDRYATAAFAPTAPWQRIGEYRNVTLEDVIAEVQQPTLFCGDIDGEVAATLRGALGARAQFPAPVANVRRPGYLAELAWQRLQQSDIDQLAALEPIYLGQPVKPKQ